MEIGSDEEKKEEEEEDDDGIIALDEFEDADGPVWQWMDNNNTWRNFSSSDIRILEEVLADRKRFKELKIGYSKYVVDLQEGTQFNVMSTRTRSVRRIPPYNRTGLRTEPPAGYTEETGTDVEGHPGQTKYVRIFYEDIVVTDLDV